MALRERHRRFVEAFLGPAAGNATKAAVMAGVPRKGAAVQAWRLLRNVKVQQAIAQRQERRTARGLANADEVDEFFTNTMRDGTQEMKHRIRAGVELNRVSGRHSVNVNLKGKLTLEEVLGASRKGA